MFKLKLPSIENTKAIANLTLTDFLQNYNPHRRVLKRRTNFLSQRLKQSRLRSVNKAPEDGMRIRGS